MSARHSWFYLTLLAVRVEGAFLTTWTVRLNVKMPDSGGFVLLTRFWFGASEQSGDVAAMADDDEDHHEQAKAEQNQIPGACADHAKKQGAKDADASRHGGQGNVASGEKDGEPDDQATQHGQRGNAEQHPGGGGHAFAAFEAEPEGEHVPEHGGETGDDGGGGEQGGGLGHGAQPLFGQPDGQPAFQQIEDENGDADAFAEHADGIGGADITTAVLTDVEALQLTREVAKRCGSAHVTADCTENNRQDWIHAVHLASVRRGAKRKKLRACLP